jgi:hypothetical protein
MRRADHLRSTSVLESGATPSEVSVASILASSTSDNQSLKNGADSLGSLEGKESGDAHRALESAVQQRIQFRLAGRVRNLVVRCRGDVVVLEGECNTYYTKQLAQHAAMGILEDEHLENAIVVCLPH